jgi:uncharacterized protein
MKLQIKKEVFAAGLCIGLGLVILGFCLKGAIENFKAKDRVVTVKGLSEKEVPADRVIWPLTFKEIGDDLSVMNASILVKNKTIVDYLKANGIKESEILVSAPEIIDMQAERYSSTPSTYRYNITSIVTVTSSEVEKVRLLIGRQNELIKKGIAITGDDYRFQKQFLYTKLNAIKPGMIEEATKNARASALKFAQDSESKLGKIKTADQGQFSITDRDANTPHIKTIRVVTTINYYLED